MMDVRRKDTNRFRLPAGQVAGLTVLFAALLVALFVFPGHVELILGGVVAATGAGKLVAGHLERDESDELPLASRAFRTLADPSQPLPDDAPISGPGNRGQLSAVDGRIRSDA